MKKLKAIFLSLIIAILSSQLISCGTEEKIYTFFSMEAREWIEPEYIRERLYGEELIYLIKDQQTYGKMFKDCAPAVDFSNHMVVLYIRSSAGTSGDLSINDTTLKDDGTVLVTVERSFDYTTDDTFGGLSAPVVAYFMLVIERQNATSAKVVFAS